MTPKKNASTTNTNAQIPPKWLRMMDSRMTGASLEYQAKSQLSSASLKSGAGTGGEVPAWLGTMMYGRMRLLAPEPPTSVQIEKSLLNQYLGSDAAKDAAIRDQIRSAAKKLNIKDTKPSWLVTRDYLLKGAPIK